MALIFLSYRRTDSPQACRVYDWLVRQFGEDAVFMDVESIRVAEDFPERIRKSICRSKTLIALIGTRWLERINDPNDWVRQEVETAVFEKVPVVPVLIGDTPMPGPQDLPESISLIAHKNAFSVGVSRDFAHDMQSLIPELERILRALAKEGPSKFGKRVIERVCFKMMETLKRDYESENGDSDLTWMVVNAQDLSGRDRPPGVTFFLHRITRWANVLELHFLLSCWGRNAVEETVLTDWIMWKFDQMPAISSKHFWQPSENLLGDVKVRHSHEDAREIWRTITDVPFHLSLTYIASVSPRSE